MDNLNGSWEGSISLPGNQLAMTVHFVESNESLAATIDIQGAQGLPLTNVSRDGNNVHFELQAGPGVAVFKGAVASSGISGTFSQGGVNAPFSLELTDGAPPSEATTLEESGVMTETGIAILGRWEGAILIQGVNLGMVVNFSDADGMLAATMDISEQSALGLPLTNVSAADGNVHFELVAGPGLAVFEGQVEGDFMGGSFRQNGVGTFYLNRVDEDALEPVELPYAAEEVEFSNDTITLAGTLTIPESDGPHPAVVLVTGSGAQNRDEEILGFKVFGVIADHLTRNGIAVLRYDDRGVGGSSGSIAASTAEDFAGDVLAGIELLRQRPDIKSDQVGILGHSEGGIVAPVAASRSEDVAFIILMAGSAVPGDAILLEQGELGLRVEGATEEAVRKKRELQLAIFHSVRTNEDWDVAREHVETELREAIESAPENTRNSLGDIETYIQNTTDASIAGVQNDWFRYFLDYDPGVALRQVTVPVLGLFGEKDLQVPPSQNGPVMEQALRDGGNTDFSVEIIPEANHLFQQAGTGSVSEYATLPKEFAEGFLSRITEWITARTM